MTDSIENQITEKEKELLRHNEAYSLVRIKLLELDAKVTSLKQEMSPLRIALAQSRTAKERINLEIKMLTESYWRERKGMA